MSFKGNRNFDKCQVSQVTPKTQYLTSEGIYESVKPKDFDRIKPDEGELKIQYTAILNCPVTKKRPGTIESNYVWPDQVQAKKDLRKVAGEIICSSCTFANMTPAEVAEEQLKLAKTEYERQQIANESIALAKQNLAAITELHEQSPDVIPDPKALNLFQFWEQP